MKYWISKLLMLISVLSFSQGSEQLSKFENDVDVFLATYIIDGIVDYESITKDQTGTSNLIKQIEKMDLSMLGPSEKQSFYINAYNIIVIDLVVKNYPVASVKDIPGFFNRIKYNVGGDMMTLNKIEKDKLLNAFGDSRFHLVLVCGAMDCPKLSNKAYRSNDFERQMVQRSKDILNDNTFVQIENGEYKISEIFKWNRFEFGGKNDIIDFINEYRTIHIDKNSKVTYYQYNWTLNDTRFSNSSEGRLANNSFRYVVTAAIPKGGIEVKVFNNLYSQIEGRGDKMDNRSTYFTSLLSFLYGTSNRFNVGFASRYRRVLNNQLPSYGFDVFGALEDENGRQRISAFGPQIRWAPFKNLSNFSIQSSLTFPVGTELAGGSQGPFLDWAGPVFWTQFFNDKSIGDQFSLFTEIDLLIEEIGGSSKANRVSTPVTVILSCFPKKNLTFYGLAGYSPYLVQPYDYFFQLGVGMKYQLSPNFEIELLATDFSNRFLNSIEGSASTLNIGFRYSR